MYKPDLWSRVVGDHGRKLLSLAFNFDVLSLKMLTFGVETMKVTLTGTNYRFLGSDMAIPRALT